MAKETQAFVYKWTEISTGKWYIGSHASKGCHPNDGYKCSSRIVKKLITENPNNWCREIFLMASPKDAIPYETELLIGLDARHDSMSYNLHNGNGKWSFAGKIGNRKGKAPWNKGLTKETSPIVAQAAQSESIAKKGCIGTNKGKKFGKQSLDRIENRVSHYRGKQRSKEVRDKISETKRLNNLIKEKQTWEELYGIEKAAERRLQLANRNRNSNKIFQ